MPWNRSRVRARGPRPALRLGAADAAVATVVVAAHPASQVARSRLRTAGVKGATTRLRPRSTRSCPRRRTRASSPRPTSSWARPTTRWTWTVRLSDAGLNTVTVAYATANGTAVAGGCNGDYIATAGTLTFAPNETEKVVSVELPTAPPSSRSSRSRSCSAHPRTRRSRERARGSGSWTRTLRWTRRRCSCATRWWTRRTAPPASRCCWAATPARCRTRS